MKGQVNANERSVVIFYRRRAGKRCPRLPRTSARCPAPERAKGWACQEWRRGRNTKATEFRIMVPRLRHSIAPYCFQVIYYEAFDESTAY